MDNFGIFFDISKTAGDHTTLSANVFIHRHEIKKLFYITDCEDASVCEIEVEYIRPENFGAEELIHLLQQIRANAPECAVFMAVAPKQVPTLLSMPDCRRLYFCNALGSYSAENLKRMIRLGCGSDYLPEEILKDCLPPFGDECKDLAFEQLVDTVLELYDVKRIPHAIGCAETAAALAKHYCADVQAAARAGILHDITKVLTVPEQLRLCEKYGIMTDEYSGQMSKLLHGKTAAAIAKHIFGERDDVCEAISWHTTGKADMTLLSKIIYIADYIEPNRKFEGVDDLRQLAFSNLDDAVLRGIDMTIETLRANNRPLNRYSLEARDFLRSEANA